MQHEPLPMRALAHLHRDEFHTRPSNPRPVRRANPPSYYMALDEGYDALARARFILGRLRAKGFEPDGKTVDEINEAYRVLCGRGVRCMTLSMCEVVREFAGGEVCA